MKTKDQIEEMAEKYKLEFTKCPDQIALEQLIKHLKEWVLLLMVITEKQDLKQATNKRKRCTRRNKQGISALFQHAKHTADVKVDYVKLIRFSDDTYTWITGSPRFWISYG